jgi:peptide/nickel transport system permease protein
LDSFNKKQKNRYFYFSLAFICLFFLIALFAPFIATYDPLLIDLNHIKEPPSASHLLGTDTVGRDVLSRIIYGTRISLFVGVSATLLSLGFWGVIGRF